MKPLKIQLWVSKLRNKNTRLHIRCTRKPSDAAQCSARYPINFTLDAYLLSASAIGIRPNSVWQLDDGKILLQNTFGICSAVAYNFNYPNPNLLTCERIVKLKAFQENVVFVETKFHIFILLAAKLLSSAYNRKLSRQLYVATHK